MVDVNFIYMQGEAGPIVRLDRSSVISNDGEQCIVELLHALQLARGGLILLEGNLDFAGPV